MIPPSSRGAANNFVVSLLFVLSVLFSNPLLANNFNTTERSIKKDSADIPKQEPGIMYISSGATLVGGDKLYNARIINADSQQVSFASRHKKIKPKLKPKDDKPITKWYSSTPPIDNLPKYLPSHTLEKSSFRSAFSIILIQNQNPAKKYFLSKPVFSCPYNISGICTSGVGRFFYEMKGAQASPVLCTDRGPPGRA